MRGKTEYIGPYKVRHVYVKAKHQPMHWTSQGGRTYSQVCHNHWAITLNGKHIDSALTKPVAMERAKKHHIGQLLRSEIYGNSSLALAVCLATMFVW